MWQQLLTHQSRSISILNNPSIHSGGHQMNVIPTSGLSCFCVPEIPTVTGDSRGCPMCHLSQCGSFSVKAHSIRKRSDVGQQWMCSNLLSQFLVPCAQRSVGTAAPKQHPLVVLLGFAMSMYSPVTKVGKSSENLQQTETVM